MTSKTGPDSPFRSPVTLPDTWVQTLSSETADYRISVALPRDPAPAEGFPVLYLLDANAGFATVMETHRRLSRRHDATRVGPAIIVGIAQDSEALYDTSLRQRDFTDPDPHAGAPAFLGFLQNQVQPLINTGFTTNPQRQILAGHSLAGYFTLWTLLHAPKAFQGHIALSPSLWWDSSLIGKLSALDPAQLQTRLFLAAGEWEESLAPWQADQPGSQDILSRRQQRQMVSHVRALGTALSRHLTPEQLQCRIFPEEDHASIFAPGISRAMRMMLY